MRQRGKAFGCGQANGATGKDEAEAKVAKF